MKALKKSFAGATLSAFAIAAIPFASAGAITADTTINGTVNTAISLTTSGTVTIPAVTPTASGNVSVGTDTVQVTTNNATGYNLTLKMASSTTDNALHGTAGSLPAGTVATPNTWGYSLDSANLSDASLSSLTGSFAAVPVASGTAAVLKTTSSPAGSGEVTNVYYGISASTQASGTYSSVVTYTALAN